MRSLAFFPIAWLYAIITCYWYRVSPLTHKVGRERQGSWDAVGSTPRDRMKPSHFLLGARTFRTGYLLSLFEAVLSVQNCTIVPLVGCPSVFVPPCPVPTLSTQAVCVRSALVSRIRVVSDNVVEAIKIVCLFLRHV